MFNFEWLQNVYIMSKDILFNSKEKEEAHLLLLGIYTAVGISLHNFPEGIAVFMACMKGTKFGIPLSLAIGQKYKIYSFYFY